MKQCLLYECNHSLALTPFPLCHTLSSFWPTCLLINEWHTFWMALKPKNRFVPQNLKEESRKVCKSGLPLWPLMFLRILRGKSRYQCLVSSMMKFDTIPKLYTFQNCGIWDSKVFFLLLTHCYDFSADFSQAISLYTPQL